MDESLSQPFEAPPGLTCRTLWRRQVGRSLAGLWSLLRRTPVGGLLHRSLVDGLQLRTVELPLPRLDPRLDGLKIAWLSDLHAGPFLKEEDFTRLGERLAAEEPDLVVLGGDLVDTHWTQVKHIGPMLERLSPRLGTVAVPGNHEYFRHDYVAPWCAYLAERGVEVLINRGLRLDSGGASLWIGGVDDLTEGRPDITRALSGRRPSDACILLSHHPDLFQRAVHYSIDLQLSGHTHGGQVKLFGKAPITHSNHGFVDGLFHRDSSQLYVGRGIGVTMAPIRFGAPAELPILRLRSV